MGRDEVRWDLGFNPGARMSLENIGVADIQSHVEIKKFRFLSVMKKVLAKIQELCGIILYHDVYVSLRDSQVEHCLDEHPEPLNWERVHGLPHVAGHNAVLGAHMLDGLDDHPRVEPLTEMRARCERVFNKRSHSGHLL